MILMYGQRLLLMKIITLVSKHVRQNASYHNNNNNN